MKDQFTVSSLYEPLPYYVATARSAYGVPVGKLGVSTEVALALDRRVRTGPDVELFGGMLIVHGPTEGTLAEIRHAEVQNARALARGDFPG